MKYNKLRSEYVEDIMEDINELLYVSDKEGKKLRESINRKLERYHRKMLRKERK